MAYGNSSEPGVESNIERIASSDNQTESPAVPALIGQADLSNGTASPETIYEIRRKNRADKLFGEGSLLAENLKDALDETALPVYAIAPAESTESTDLSSLSQSGSLDHAPITEDPEDVTFTVGGSEASVTKVLNEDPANKTAESGEAIYNPITGDYQLSESPSSGDSAEYTTYDYSGAFSVLEGSDAAEEIDYATPLTENTSVKTGFISTAESEAGKYRLFQAVVGALPTIDPSASDVRDVTSERAKVVYPSRNADGESVLGSFVGRLARAGIEQTTINQSLRTQGQLIDELDSSQRPNLIEQGIVPLKQGANPIIADDVMAVDPSDDSYDTRFGFTRLILDFIAERAKAVEEPYIGRLNRKTVRQAFSSAVADEARALDNAGAINEYQISVRATSATSAELDLFVDTAHPLRNINNNVLLGN